MARRGAIPCRGDRVVIHLDATTRGRGWRNRGGTTSDGKVGEFTSSKRFELIALANAGACGGGDGGVRASFAGNG